MALELLRIQIWWNDPGVSGLAAQADVAVPGGTSFRLRATQVTTGCQAYVNDDLVCSRVDNWYRTSTRFGFLLPSAASTVLAFDSDDTPTVSMEVTPDPLWVGGGPVSCTATLTGAIWTPGVPGSSTVTVDHGSISDQYTPDAAHILFTYTPAEYVGVVRFTESEHGLFDDVNGTVVPQEGQGGVECRLTADGASMVNTTAAHTAGDLVTSDAVVGLGIGGAPNLTFINAIADLWYAEFRTNINPPSGYVGDDVLSKLWLIINGGWDPAVGPWPEPNGATIKQDTQGTVASLLELRGELGYTLAEVIAAVKGLDNRSVTQVYDLLEALPVDDNQNVLDMLTLMWGADTPTLTQIATLISDISTIAGYDLSDVLTAVANQDVHGHTEQVLAAIAALRGAGGHTVSEVYDLVDVVNTAVQEVKTSLQEIRAPGHYTFQDVLDAIAAIPPGGDAGTPGAPVWPGIAGVTIGPQWPLSTGLTLAGPMDGVVIQITAVAPKFNGHFYTYDDVRAYRNIGALAFVSDRGDVETYQALSFQNAIYTPRTMTRASAVKLMCPAGTAGSIRAWTINP
jgi:hypothetical protein